MKHPKSVALIPARAGSQRVPGKNIRLLQGHPLIAYAIASALESKVFDSVVVSTDSEETRRIAHHYGAETPFLRPADLATSTSPDITWIKHALGEMDNDIKVFAIIRPTSPFRGAETICRAMTQFLNTPGIDSIRAVEKCKQHPGKMWVLEESTMRPLLDQSHLEVAWHAGQYQALPEVYVQNSSLEIAWTRVVWEYNCREGRIIAPFLSNEFEGFSIDYESDWWFADHLTETGQARLPEIHCEGFPG
jgi:CMP-N,N'-diacetyllegionaminic acid synthase